MRKTLAPLVVLATVLLATACSGSDSKAGKDAAASSTTAPTTSKSTTTTAMAVEDIDATASSYCADWKAIRSKAAPTLTGDTTKDDATRRDHYRALLPTVEKLVADADPAIKPATQKALAVVRKAAETGSLSVFETDESRATQQQMADYAEQHCARAH